MYICIGTWGFAPAPKIWAEFQVVVCHFFRCFTRLTCKCKCKTKEHLLNVHFKNCNIYFDNYFLPIQDWFHQIKSGPNSSTFHPYVENTVPNSWYLTLESQGRQHTMWEMWYIHFMTKKKLFTVFNNFPAINGDGASCLGINRREVGLHYHSKGPENLCKLLSTWNTSYDNMLPEEPIKFDWYGNHIN